MPKGLQGFQKGHKFYGDLSKLNFQKGNVPWNKNKKGLQIAWNKGKKCPSLSGSNNGSWKGGISKARRGFPKGFQKGNTLGKKFGNGYVSKHKREKHWNWNGGVSTENQKIRASIESSLWKQSVFARDGYVCQKTGIKGGKLTAHHIQNFAQYPELRFAIDNGITFSKKAHREFHKKYGIKNNNKGQIEEFLLNKKK